MLGSQTQPSFHIPEWDHSIQTLLDNKEYALAAEKLLDAHKIANQQGAESVANLLLAAHQICLSCHQQLQNVRIYHKIYEHAIYQEDDFRKQLDNLLEAYIHTETAVTPTHHPQQKLGASPAHTVWQRLRSWFRQSKVPDVAAPATFKNPTSQVAISSRQTVMDKPILNAAPQPPTPVNFTQSGKEGDGETAVTASPTTSEMPKEPVLIMYSLGLFRVYYDDKPITNWPSGKGKSIFKYLIFHREHPIAKEVLMDTFWPDAHPDAARNNLNVAIYGLRQAFRTAHPNTSFVVFQNGAYSINPNLQVWVDSEAFIQQHKAAKELEDQGNLAAAMNTYRASESLYQGEFLAEDRYEDWLQPHRQKIQNIYLHLLEQLGRHYLEQKAYDSCITVCNKMIAVEPCMEAAHCRLMRCYYRQGQPFLALRQYHQCIESLKNELNATPTPKTVELYQRIRNHQPL